MLKLIFLLPIIAMFLSMPIIEKPPAYRKISAAEARAIINGGGDFILLDVRTDEEFAEKRIAGAVLKSQTLIQPS